MVALDFSLAHQFRKAKTEAPSKVLTRDRAPGGGLAQRRLGHPEALRSLRGVHQSISKRRLRYLFPNDGSNLV